MDFGSKLVDALAIVAKEAEDDAQIQQAEHLYQTKVCSLLAKHKWLEAALTWKSVLSMMAQPIIPYKY